MRKLRQGQLRLYFLLSFTLIVGILTVDVSLQSRADDNKPDIASTQNPERPPAVCWAPDSDPDDIARFYQKNTTPPNNGLAINESDYNLASRWSTTASQGSGLAQGDPLILTWSFVPDNTEIGGGCGVPGESMDPSDLIAFLDSRFGGAPSGADPNDLTLRPWFVHFTTMFDRWTELTATTYIYEPNDDGTIYGSGGGPGIVGVRGDVRIGGHRLDGNSNVLACNYFPNSGDMIIDTDDNFYNAGNILGFTNLLSHEHGHGLGFLHSCPISQSKLMEPFLTTAFDGPQEDDILAAHSHYGDIDRSNDDISSAKALGLITSGMITTLDQRSIDSDSETDYFSFEVSSNLDVTLILSPTGSTYLAGRQLSNGACEAGMPFNASVQSNIEITLLASDGTSILASSTAAPLGFDEVICMESLSSGTYYIRVGGDGTTAQMYRLSVEGDATTCPECDIVINEVDYDQGSLDDAEFIELYNPCGEAKDLTSYTLQMIDGSTNTMYRSVSLTGMIPSGGYYVICGSASQTANCNLDTEWDTDMIQDGAPDALALLNGTELIDVLSYEGDVQTYVEGSGTNLSDDPGQISQGLSRYPNGVDTDMNNIDFSRRCITPGSANEGSTTFCDSDLLCQSTLFTGSNGANGNMFDIRNLGSDDLTITSLEVNLDPGTYTIEVYYTSTADSYIGLEQDINGWTLLGSATVTSAGANLPTLVEISGLTLSPGSGKGLYITDTGGQGINYTNGVSSWSDGILEIDLDPGIGNLYPFSTFFSNRQWNGTICYISDGVPLSNLSIVATDADKNEGDSGNTFFFFTISRSGNTDISSTVDFAVSGVNPSPANAADFGSSFPQGQLSFAIGETSKSLVITVQGDTEVEADESFVLTLSNPSSGSIISISTAQGQIRNDDALQGDLCEDAIDLVLSDDCLNPIIVDISQYNMSQNPTSTNICGHPTNAVRDAWYEVIVPDDGVYIVKTTQISNDYVGAELTVYSGGCGTLVPLICRSRGLPFGHTQVEISGRSANEILFVRVNTYGSFFSRPFGICFTRPVENTLCEGAIPLVPDGSCQVFDNTLATPSLQPTSSLDCGDSRTAVDMWFTAIVPPSGHLKAETFLVEEGLTDVTMEIYEGDCGGLIPLACNAEKERSISFDRHALIELVDLVPGTTLYIRITDAFSNNVGAFELCVSDMAPQYPCRIDLILPKAQGPCDPSTNTFSQDFEIHYRADNRPQSIWMNSSLFPLTGSPQTITVPGYPSNGNLLSISAFLDGPGRDDCEVNSVYFKENAIEAAQNCFNGSVVNDECAGAVILEVGEICLEGIYDNTGATESIDPNLPDLCRFGGEHPQDVWFRFEVPASGEVVVATYDFRVSTVFDVYAGTCGALEVVGFCGSSFGSLRITDRMPGETLYVRVATNGGESQGEFGICIFEVEPYINDICDDAITLGVTPSCSSPIYSTHLSERSLNPNATISCDPTSAETRDSWFKFQMPASGDVRLITEEVERDYSDMVVEVYMGSCDNLSQIVCEYANGTQGHVVIDLLGVSPGAILYARVASGRGQAHDAFKICVLSIPNDICNGAVPLTIGDGECHPEVINYSQMTASGNPTETMSCDGFTNPSRDAWFTLTLPDEGEYIVQTTDLTGLFVGTVIEVFSGTCDDLILIQCDAGNLSVGRHTATFIRDRQPGETVFIRVGTQGSFSRPDFGICASKVANNNYCNNAIALSTDGSCLTTSNNFASPSEHPTQGLDCGDSGIGIDVWYRAIVPPSGNLSIETFQTVGGLTDVDMEVYSGSCGSLTPLSCNVQKERFGTSDTHAKVELTNQQPGQEVFIRVVDRFSNEYGEFEICATDAAPSQECNIDIIIAGDQSNCDPTTNSFSQDLTIYYRENGTIESIFINGQIIPITGSPQQITLENLPSNGNLHYLSASLNGPGFDACESNSFYYSPGIYTAPENCYSGVVDNDECSGAIPLEVMGYCSEEVYDMTGATPSLEVQLPFFCGNAGEFPQDIWFSVVVPPNGEFVVAGYFNTPVSPIYEVYRGVCGALSIMETCGFTGRSIRVSGTPGETLFIRVADSGGDHQGQVGICALAVEPAVNEICSQAVELTVGSSCTGLLYSTHFSSGEDNPTAALSCDPSTTRSRDQWFKVIAPADGQLTLFTEEVERSFSEVLIEVFDGSCTDLSLIGCDYRSGSSGHAYLDLTGITPGITLYIRVAGSRGSRWDTFRMCAIAGCPEYSVIERPLDGNLSFVVRDSIRSSSTLIESAEVIFNAGIQTIVDPGFEVKSGASLDVSTEGCEN